MNIFVGKSGYYVRMQGLLLALSAEQKLILLSLFFYSDLWLVLTSPYVMQRTVLSCNSGIQMPEPLLLFIYQLVTELSGSKCSWKICLFSLEFI